MKYIYLSQRVTRQPDCFAQIDRNSDLIRDVYIYLASMQQTKNVDVSLNVSEFAKLFGYSKGGLFKKLPLKDKRLAGIQDPSPQMRSIIGNAISRISSKILVFEEWNMAESRFDQIEERLIQKVKFRGGFSHSYEFNIFAFMQRDIAAGKTHTGIFADTKRFATKINLEDYCKLRGYEHGRKLQKLYLYMCWACKTNIGKTLIDYHNLKRMLNVNFKQEGKNAWYIKMLLNTLEIETDLNFVSDVVASGTYYNKEHKEDKKNYKVKVRRARGEDQFKKEVAA